MCPVRCSCMDREPLSDSTLSTDAKVHLTFKLYNFQRFRNIVNDIWIDIIIIKGQIKIMMTSKQKNHHHSSCTVCIKASFFSDSEIIITHHHHVTYPPELDSM